MMPSLCLNMIVRNEAHIITETLECVASLIDYWVIVDTGSTDETETVVKLFFDRRGIPGEMHRRPWRDFGHNRSEALELCVGKADYVWVIDADDLVVGGLELSDDLSSHLDSYALKYGKRFRYWRKQIFLNDGSWRYEGVVHEYPVNDRGQCTEACVEGAYYIDSRRLGDRNRDARKYKQDAELLLAAVQRDPLNERNVFYLAQSYFDAGEYVQALDRYRQRVAMAGWPEEVYYALFRAAVCLARLGRWHEALESFLLAHECRPQRAEPLYEIAQHNRLADKFQLGYQFARLASEIPYPEGDTLFIDREVYDYRTKDERAISAYYLGRYGESYALCQELLDGDLPSAGERARIERNRDFAQEKLK